jgi:outer membrane protein assembly factor BamA
MGTKDQHDESIQPSRIMAVVYLTLNKQYKAFVTSDLIFGKNKYESFTELMFIDFPNFYYGIGDDTKLEDECWVETENLSLEQAFGYKFNKNWYIGIKYHYNNYYKVDSVANTEVCTFDFSGLEQNRGVQSGIGFKISRETRDNRLNARKGSFLLFEFLNYGKWIGSKFEYNSMVFDYRKFITPKKWLTIAGQIYAEAKPGNVPIQSLALMGGDNRMRGVYIGRFRDKTMIEGQIELRFPIYWIFSGTLFSGLGEVAPKLRNYTLQGIKWTYGAGLRLNVNQATRSNVRFDIGFFEHKPLFFFNFTEAF